MSTKLKKIGVGLLTVITLIAFSTFTLSPHRAEASVTLLQTASGNGGGYVNSYTLALGSNVVAGDVLVLALVGGINDRIASLTDNQNGAWTFIASTTNTTSARASQLFYVPNTVAGATTITITYLSGQFNDSAMIVREYSGLSNPSLDVFATSTDIGAPTLHTSGTTAPVAKSGELIFATLGNASSTETYTAGSGYSNLASQRGNDIYTGIAIEDQTTLLQGTKTATMTTGDARESQMIIATFKTPENHGKGMVKGAKAYIKGAKGYIK